MIAQNSLLQNKWAVSPYCKLLLKMDGANGGTSFVDMSGNNVTITPTSVTTSTTQKRFGSTASYYTGTTTNLRVPSTFTTLGTNNFTISFWVYVVGTPSFWGLLGIHGSGRICTLRVDSGTSYFYTASTSGTFTPPAINSWNHYVIIRASNVWYLYINGVLASTVSDSASISAYDLYIGADYDGGGGLTGYIDEFAVWNGVAIPISDLYPARAPLYDYAVAEWGGK